MQNNPSFIAKIDQILLNLDKSPSLELGVNLCLEILKLMGYQISKSPIDIIDEELIQLPNSERYDSWFQNHPWMGGERSVFEIADFDEAPLQAKFYWLNKRSRQFIAGSVHFTENWEDSDYTHNDKFKVGIDFFLSPNGKSLHVVLSNRGNLRIVELHKRLNNTQIEIFSKWKGIYRLTSQESLHNTLWESFKLKTVNEKFYAEIANNFTLLTQHLKSIGKDEEESKLFASRLLGRLLFCWFLRKKGIIDESMNYFDTDSLDDTKYYKQSLERLFFLTLNTPIDERYDINNKKQKKPIHILNESKQSSIFKIDDKTPYLNGGLFEAHNNDWFNDETLTFPKGFFVNLYKHFDEFNFTTDESTPEYEQIAIDPEMLGRVFESLLATQVDQTGQQARKAKGTFYTPREIVSYMCKESLRKYMYNYFHNNIDIKQSIDGLLDISDSEWAKSGSNTKRDTLKNYKEQIINSLDLISVLDPACGSGAFPMGMVQLLMKIYERLESRFDSYKTKLQIIQNNIFGVDIEPMAIEIARLRAWLSLIIDEEEGRIVEPLPNLDFKFVCANSLLVLEEGDALNLWQDADHDKKLGHIREEYFGAKSKTKKNKLKKEYYAVTSQTDINQSKRIHQLNSFNPFKNNEPAVFFDSDQMFGLIAFDIVVSNPPYVSVEKIDKSIKENVKQFKTAYQKYDLYVLFYEKGLDFLKNGGVLSYITSNKFLSQGYGLKLRKLLLQNTINQIINFNYDIFESATVRTCIVQVLKSVADYDQSIEIIDVSHNTDAYKFKNRQFDYLRQNIFNYTEENNFRINLNNAKIKLLQEIENNSLKLEEICSVNYGLRPSSEKLNLKKKSFIFENNEGKYKKYFEGKDMGYWLIKKSHFLDYRPEIMYNAMFPELFENDKLVGLRTLSDINKLRFIFDDQGHYCNDSVVILTLWHKLKDVKSRTIIKTISPDRIEISKKFKYQYLQAILNSDLIKFYVSELLYDGTHFYPNHMKSLPIKNISENEQRPLIEVVDKILIAQNNGRSSQLLEKELNSLVYKLYNINEDEINFIKSKDSTKSMY